MSIFCAISKCHFW